MCVFGADFYAIGARRRSKSLKTITDVARTILQTGPSECMNYYYTQCVLVHFLKIRYGCCVLVFHQPQGSDLSVSAQRKRGWSSQLSQVLLLQCVVCACVQQVSSLLGLGGGGASRKQQQQRSHWSRLGFKGPKSPLNPPNLFGIPLVSDFSPQHHVRGPLGKQKTFRVCFFLQTTTGTFGFRVSARAA